MTVLTKEQQDDFIQLVIDFLLADSTSPETLQVGVYRRNYAQNAQMLFNQEALRRGLKQVDPDGRIFLPIEKSSAAWHRLLMYVADKLGPEQLAFIDGQVAALDQFNISEVNSFSKQCVYPHIFRKK